MKTVPTLLASLCLLLGACAGDEAAPRSAERPAPLRSDVDLSQYQPCSIDQPCADGFDCVVLGLPEGDSEPLCIEAGEACDLVDCGADQCLLLESYPAQVRCGGGSCEGDDCDDPVSSDG